MKKLQGLEEGLAQDPVWLCQQLLLDLRKGPTELRKFCVFCNFRGHPVHIASGRILPCSLPALFFYFFLLKHPL